MLVPEYPLRWAKSKRPKILFISLLLVTSLFGSFVNMLAGWVAVAAAGTTEHYLAAGLLAVFAFAMLVMGIYAYYTLNIIFSWVEGFVELCAQAAAAEGEPQHLEARVAHAIQAFRRLEASFGPIGLFCIAYGQVCTILELYKVPVRWSYY